MRKTARTNLDFDLDFEDHEAPLEKASGSTGRFLSATRVGVAGLALLSLAIVVNATLLQDQKHAAPLFKLDLAQRAAPTSDVAPPAPAPRPAEFAAAPAPQAEPERAPAAAPPVRHAKTQHADARRADPIAGLIRDVNAVVAPSTEPDPEVFAAQRALQRLGFVIRPDGVLGATTRQAIERFERDRNLPVRGELTPKIRRELARLAAGGA